MKKQTVACMKLLIMVSKFLSCWSHHKLRLQRPMAARNLSEMAQSVHNKVLTLLVVYMINERMSYEYRITY